MNASTESPTVRREARFLSVGDTVVRPLVSADATITAVRHGGNTIFVTFDDGSTSAFPPAHHVYIIGA